MTQEHTTPARPDGAFDPASMASLAPSSSCPVADSASADLGVPLIDDHYDPADYRWVPVRRQPRFDGWTEEKQRRFIEVLADTGLVSHAAKAVGMTRESANRLRRSPRAAAFSRAWDAARHHAGAALEDLAFERAIEGVEQNVFNEYGEVICTKRVYNDRLLTFLLRHLKPERYARDALSAPPPPLEPLDVSLRALEPQLPAPPEALLDPEVLEHELMLADLTDGELPHFLTEQHPPKSAAREAAEAAAAQQARGEAALERITNKAVDERIEVSHQDMIDITRLLDPTSVNDRPRRRFK
jgi:hypothetical protein